MFLWEKHLIPTKNSILLHKIILFLWGKKLIITRKASHFYEKNIFSQEKCPCIKGKHFIIIRTLSCYYMTVSCFYEKNISFLQENILFVQKPHYYENTILLHKIISFLWETFRYYKNILWEYYIVITQKLSCFYEEKNKFSHFHEKSIPVLKENISLLWEHYLVIIQNYLVFTIKTLLLQKHLIMRILSCYCMKMSCSNEKYISILQENTSVL